MNLSFPANKSTELSFKLSVAGTQAAPEVSALLTQGDLTLSYAARKVSDDQWSARIERPGTMLGHGEVKFCVRVEISGHAFYPLRTTASVVPDQLVTVTVEPVVPPPEIFNPTEPALAAPPTEITPTIVLPTVEEVDFSLLSKINEGTPSRPSRPRKASENLVESAPIFKLIKTKVIYL